MEEVIKFIIAKNSRKKPLVYENSNFNKWFLET